MKIVFTRAQIAIVLREFVAREWNIPLASLEDDVGFNLVQSAGPQALHFDNASISVRTENARPIKEPSKTL